LFEERPGYRRSVKRLGFLLALRLKTSLWVIPFACAVAGIGLSLITVAIDRGLQHELIPRSVTGDPTSALTILSTIAYSMVSLTALVVTITAVVVQLAMGQFSPRSVRPFLHDRPSQFAIGVFVGAFAHAMFAMREVHSFTEQGSVPGVTIVVAYVLVFVSVTLLVGYVHHIGNSLKADSIIESVGAETRALLDKLYAPSASPDERAPNVITTDRGGVIFQVDYDELIARAEAADVTLVRIHAMGTFVPRGAPLVRWEGEAGDLDEVAIRRAVAVGPERTMDQDGAFGVQILVDIVERSLSEGFSDQTTACQGIDRLHDIIRSLSGRQFPSGRLCDAAGRERLIIPEPGWDDYVAIAFDRVIAAGIGSRAVMQRLQEALEDLLTVTSDDRRPAIESRLRTVSEAAESTQVGNVREPGPPDRDLPPGEWRVAMVSPRDVD
jgi:uncharacterized membrane protein